MKLICRKIVINNYINSYKIFIENNDSKRFKKKCLQLICYVIYNLEIFDL